MCLLRRVLGWHQHQSIVRHAAAADVLQGMVFFAFGFNLVDCGGLLGGRLDSGDTKLPAKKVLFKILHYQCLCRQSDVGHSPLYAMPGVCQAMACSRRVWRRRPLPDLQAVDAAAMLLT